MNTTMLGMCRALGFTIAVEDGDATLRHVTLDLGGGASAWRPGFASRARKAPPSSTRLLIEQG